MVVQAAPLAVEESPGPLGIPPQVMQLPPSRAPVADFITVAMQVPAFVSGGLVPVERHGTVDTSLTHLSDWFPTLLALAGVQPAGDGTTNGGGMPPVDGIDLWPLVQGEPLARGHDSLMLGVDNAFGGTVATLVEMGPTFLDRHSTRATGLRSG